MYTIYTLSANVPFMGLYGLGFQHLPRDLANVNAWKTMFDPYIPQKYIDVIPLLRSIKKLSADIF